MKVAVSVVAAWLALVSPAVAQQVWFGLPHGFFGPTGDNEAQLVSTMPDPVKLRLGIYRDRVESNLGGLSFNTLRPDGTNDEWGLLMGRLTANKEQGAFYIALADRYDAPVTQKFYIDPGAAIFSVPVYAPNLSGGGGGPPTDHLRAGAYGLYIQTDGNLVIYERVGETQCPRWAITWLPYNGTGYIDRNLLAPPCN